MFRSQAGAGSAVDDPGGGIDDPGGGDIDDLGSLDNLATSTTTSSKTSVSFVSSSLTTGFSLLSLSDKSAVDVVRLGGRRWYLKSYTPSLCCTTNTIRQSQPKGFIATFQTPPFSAAIETTPGYRPLSNYPVRRCPFCTRKLVNQVP